MRRACLALLVVAAVAGCALPQPQPPTQSAPVTPVVSTPATPTPPAFEPRFDGARAWEQVAAQVRDAAGAPRYRVPNTTGNEEVARLIEAELAPLGFTVAWHHFNATYGCERTAMHNVVAERRGATDRLVLFTAHYDTRPIADKDPDPARRGDPILGANDGASGVGVLLELARVLPTSGPTVRFVFFDGEDGGGSWKGCRTEWILGSTAYAATLTEAERARIDAVVLVDMIGDKDLKLPREGFTADDARSRAVQSAIYASARALGHEQFLDARGPTITDDHVPFLERGLPAVDLIHLIPGASSPFPSWHHTLADDLDAVSAASLGAVGETLEAWFVSLN